MRLAFGGGFLRLRYSLTISLRRPPVGENDKEKLVKPLTGQGFF